MANIVDEQTDTQVAAVAGLLHASIRSQFGNAACTRTYEWPIRSELAPMLQFPALCVYRESDRSEPASDTVEDVRTITLRIDYYAPITPLDRVELRWPLLHAVWTHVLKVLRIGWHSSYNDGAVPPATPTAYRLADVGFETPAPVVGVARYQAAQVDAGIVPSFLGTVTMRASDYHDLSDYPTDDLVTIVTTANADDDTHAPVFDAIVDDLDIP